MGVHGGGMISQIGRVVERSRGSQSISVQPLFSTPRTLQGTGQAGRFILNDIKKQAGDLCAQIVLSPCCSSRDLRRCWPT